MDEGVLTIHRFLADLLTDCLFHGLLDAQYVPGHICECSLAGFFYTVFRYKHLALVLLIVESWKLAVVKTCAQNHAHE